MNKSNAASVSNYLNNASLFRTSQKNRFVSAFVSHQNYFQREQQQQQANSIHPPNLTKSKKENPFVLGESMQLGPSEVNKTDALKATIKKDA